MIMKMVSIDSVFDSEYSTSDERVSTTDFVNKSTEYRLNSMLEIVFPVN